LARISQLTGCRFRKPRATIFENECGAARHDLNIYQLKNSIIMALQPLSDRVLVRPAAAEQKTASGIIIPDSAKEKPLKGEVLAVGPGTKDETMQVRVGDVVLFGKYAGTEIEVDGEKLLIMRQSDIFAKF